MPRQVGVELIVTEKGSGIFNAAGQQVEAFAAQQKALGSWASGTTQVLSEQQSQLSAWTSTSTSASSSAFQLAASQESAAKATGLQGAQLRLWSAAADDGASATTRLASAGMGATVVSDKLAVSKARAAGESINFGRAATSAAMGIRGLESAASSYLGINIPFAGQAADALMAADAVDDLGGGVKKLSAALPAMTAALQSSAVAAAATTAGLAALAVAAPLAVAKVGQLAMVASDLSNELDLVAQAEVRAGEETDRQRDIYRRVAEAAHMTEGELRSWHATLGDLMEAANGTGASSALLANAIDEVTKASTKARESMASWERAGKSWAAANVASGAALLGAAAMDASVALYEAAGGTDAWLESLKVSNAETAKGEQTMNALAQQLGVTREQLSQFGSTVEELQAHADADPGGVIAQGLAKIEASGGAVAIAAVTERAQEASDTLSSAALAAEMFGTAVADNSAYAVESIAATVGALDEVQAKIAGIKMQRDIAQGPDRDLSGAQRGRLAGIADQAASVEGSAATAAWREAFARAIASGNLAGAADITTSVGAEGRMRNRFDPGAGDAFARLSGLLGQLLNQARSAVEGGDAGGATTGGRGGSTSGGFGIAQAVGDAVRDAAKGFAAQPIIVNMNVDGRQLTSMVVDRMARGEDKRI